MDRAGLHILGVMLLLGVAAGCAGSIKNAEVILPGAPVVLGDHEGLLIIQIDTDVPLEQVLFTRGTVASALPKGKHLWIIRAPVGLYEWQRIDLGSQAGVAESHFTRDVELSNENEFEFEVLSGTINYPGELIVRTDDFSRSSGRVWIRNRNRSAMAIRRLSRTHTELLDAFPIRHVGWSEDGFLEFYTHKRRSMASGIGSEEK